MFALATVEENRRFAPNAPERNFLASAEASSFEALACRKVSLWRKRNLYLPDSFLISHSRNLRDGESTSAGLRQVAQSSR